MLPLRVQAYRSWLSLLPAGAANLRTPGEAVFWDGPRPRRPHCSSIPWGNECHRAPAVGGPAGVLSSVCLPALTVRVRLPS